MPKELTTLEGLDTGDVVAHILEPFQTFIVTHNYGDHVTAVATVDISNAQEWELRAKATHKVV